MHSAKSLTWLHLSDLHFGHGAEAKARFDQKAVTSALLRDAELVAGELGPPDLVFLTGDIAFSASADKEYPAAKVWLDKLLVTLKIGPERLLLVPGNHDVDRKKALSGNGQLLHKGLRADPHHVDELLENADQMAAVWSKLDAYQQFAKAFGSPEVNPSKPFWRKRIDTALGPIELIGLNTALLSFDKEDCQKNLALGLGQMHLAFDAADRDALLFVLQHHPPSWLLDGNDLLDMLAERPHVLFYGHIHEANGLSTLPLTRRGNLELVAGAGHQDAKEEGNHAYAWGQLTQEGLFYYPRLCRKGAPKFLPQPIDPPDDQKRHTPKLGEFVRFPREKLPDGLAKWLGKAPTAPIPDPSPGPTVPVLRTPNPSNAYFSVPFQPKGKRVIGRADALQRVREQLVKGQRTNIGQTAAFVGLGGLGKTQLALEYAHAYKKQYPGGVYWFNADGDLGTQLTRLAVDAGWASPMSEAWYKFETATREIRTRSNCLIVFDNVEDLAAIQELMPEASAKPHLLITSRVAQVGFDSVPIEQLSEEQSLEMLQSESGREPELPEDLEAAQRIAKQLEGLPLALELAGAYLKRFPKVSWSSYAKHLEEEGIRARGLHDGPLASFTKHNANLYATLHIDESFLADQPLLRRALDVLAWSGSTAMGVGLLAALLDCNGFALEVALGEAESLKIVKQEQSETGRSTARFQMHRLVGEVRRAEVALEQESARWVEVIGRLGTWFEERRREFGNLGLYEVELDHLEMWQRRAAGLGQSREAVRLLWLQAYPHYHRGRYQRAHDIIENALGLFEKVAVGDRLLEAHLRNDLGFTLGHVGDRRKAFAHAQKALEIRLEILGEHHPDTTTSIDNVVTSHFGLGEYVEGFEFAERGLRVRLETLNQVGSDIVMSLLSVGEGLWWLRRYHEALPYEQRALALQFECLGEKHPQTAQCFFNLGYTFDKLGEYTKALQHMRSALAIRREVLGDRHRDTLRSWKNIVEMLLREGKRGDAYALIESDLKKFPQNATLKRLKAEIGGKHAAKTPTRPATTSSKKTKSPKR